MRPEMSVCQTKRWLVVEDLSISLQLVSLFSLTWVSTTLLQKIQFVRGSGFYNLAAWEPGILQGLLNSERHGESKSLGSSLYEPMVLFLKGSDGTYMVHLCIFGAAIRNQLQLLTHLREAVLTVEVAGLSDFGVFPGQDFPFALQFDVNVVDDFVGNFTSFFSQLLWKIIERWNSYSIFQDAKNTRSKRHENIPGLV